MAIKLAHRALQEVGGYLRGSAVVRADPRTSQKKATAIHKGQTARIDVIVALGENSAK